MEVPANPTSGQTQYRTRPTGNTARREGTDTPSRRRAGGSTLARRLSQPVAEPVSDEWHVGDVVLNLYEVKSLLGEGGMGKVFLVHHRGWDVDLAVKCPRAEIFHDVVGQQDFIREAETWVNLGIHPHNVSCYYVRTLSGIPRVFAEYVEAGSLGDWITDKRLYAGGHDQAVSRILDIAIQFAWGLHYAHEQGIVHQDVKPANVMLTADGVAKVTDFGLARAMKLAENPSGEGAPCTPEYASPEQMEGGRVTRSADVWSYALSVLEMFAGQMPVLGPMANVMLESYLELGSPRPEIPRMPMPLLDLLKACFTVDPDERPQSLHDVALRLIELFETHTGTAYPRVEPKAARLQADALNNRAVSLMDLGRSDDALQLLEDAVVVDSQHLYALYNRGLLLWRRGALTDVALLDVFRELTTIYHKAWDLRLIIGWIHIERGDEASARRSFAEARHLAGANATAAGMIEHAEKTVEPGYQRVGILSGHTDFVHSVALRADGRLAVSGGADSVVRLWDVADMKAFKTLKGHGDRINSVALSMEGRMIFTASHDNTVRVWDAESQRLLRTLEGHQGPVYSVSPSPDGRLAASGGEDGTVKVWDVTNNRVVQVMIGHQGAVRAVVLLATLARIVSAGDDGHIYVWDGRTNQLLITLEGHAGPVTCLAVTADGLTILSGGSDRTLRLWDTVTGACRQILEGHSGAVSGVALSSDGQWGVSSGDDRTLRMWDLEAGCCLRTIEGEKARMYTVAMTPSGNLAVAAGADTEMTLWQLPESLPTAHPMVVRPRKSEEMLSSEEGYGTLLSQAREAIEREDWPAAVAAVREARRLPGYERSPECLTLWEELGPKAFRTDLLAVWPMGTLEGHHGWVNAVAMVADGSLAVSGGEDGTVRIWNLTIGDCAYVLEGHTGPVTEVRVSEDGAVVASQARDGTVRVWDAEEGVCRLVIPNQGTGLDMTPDGAIVITSGKDGTLRLWDVAGGRVARILQQGTLVSLTPDARYVLTTTQDFAVRVWDIAARRCVHSFKGHTEAVREVCLSPDARVAVSASEDKTVRVWEVAANRPRHVLKGHTRGVTGLAMTPDGSTAVSCSKDQSLRVWNLSTGACSGTLLGHGDMVTGVDLAADARSVVSSSRDGTIRLWHLDWDLAPKEQADWDEAALPLLEVFLSGLTPRQSDDLTQDAAWVRRGRPVWMVPEFEALMQHLASQSYGWLRVDGVEQRLQTMVETWTEGPTV